MAVFNRPTGSYAVVNGRAIRVGQSLKGFKLVHVTDRGARFENGEVGLELKIDTRTSIEGKVAPSQVQKNVENIR